MSFFARVFGRPAHKPAPSNHPSPADFAEPPPPTPVAATATARPATTPPAPDQVSSRPGERSARREMVYAAVRESMVRSGILSSGYKFKVLALDKRATQFMVMVDLAEQFAAMPGRLAEIEALIAYAAKSRFDILVTAVYWRLNSQLGVSASKLKPAAVNAQPLTTQGMPTAPAPTPPLSQTPAIEPLEEAEIEAFKQALRQAAMRPSPPTDGQSLTEAIPVTGKRSKTSPIASPVQPVRPGAVPAPIANTNYGGLSSTQFGELRQERVDD